MTPMYIVAAATPAMPNSFDSASTITLSAAAGPETWNCELPQRAATAPPITPATSPALGGIPLAIARPTLSGNATADTVRPARRSWPQERALSASDHVSR